MSSIPMTRFITAPALALAMLALSHGDVRAQSTEVDRQVTAESEASDAPLTRAQLLRAEAERMPSSPENWRALKRLYKAAARAADDNDILRADDLRMAAVLAHSLHDLREAQELFTRSAELAADLGDPYRSCHCFLNAAILSAERGDLTRARYLLERAKRLSVSPLLSQPQSDLLRERIANLEGGAQ